MSEIKLNSHWENPNGPRALMKKVYYKKDVDEILERSIIFNSCSDAWEVQRAIFDRIKVYCQWAKSYNFFADEVRYKNHVKEIKRLCFFWKCLEQIRFNIRQKEVIE